MAFQIMVENKWIASRFFLMNIWLPKQRHRLQEGGERKHKKRGKLHIMAVNGDIKWEFKYKSMVVNKKIKVAPVF